MVEEEKSEGCLTEIKNEKQWGEALHIAEGDLESM